MRSSSASSSALLLLGLTAVTSASPLAGRGMPVWKRQAGGVTATATTGGLSTASSGATSSGALPTSIAVAGGSGGANVTRDWSWNWTTDKMHGVSLGNWLVLERWMDEEWFVSTSNEQAEDEWTWSEIQGDNKNATLLEHWNSWITDDDIRFIAESGFNHLRIPVGYWAWIAEPAGTPYASMAGQVEQITRVLQSAYNYGLHVGIDLHGMPGSQNGEQPSGHIGYNNWYQGDNQRYGDDAVDAIIDYITTSPYREAISHLEVVNEPVYYNEQDYQTLLAYYERTYAKLTALTPPIPMAFAFGKPDSDPMALWQGFINGKDPELLFVSEHPYVGRNWGTQDQDYMLEQVCNRAERYANYGVPVAVTEWSLSTDILNNPDWVSRFFSTQARAWHQSAGGVFWNYRVNAYHNSNEQQTAENFTLYSFVDVAMNGHVPLPEAGQTSEEYIYSLPDFCRLGNTTDTYVSPVPSISPTVTRAFPSATSRH